MESHLDRKTTGERNGPFGFLRKKMYILFLNTHHFRRLQSACSQKNSSAVGLVLVSSLLSGECNNHWHLRRSHHPDSRALLQNHYAGSRQDCLNIRYRCHSHLDTNLMGMLQQGDHLRERERYITKLVSSGFICCAIQPGSPYRFP